MVSLQTIKQIRTEYKDYLTKSNPDWSINTVNTHVSDAFYLWNNEIVRSFWECLASEEAMQEARAELLNYLRTEVMSERAEERAGEYYNDLCGLKKYIDETYGSIQNRVGAEYDAEKVMYAYCRNVYEETMTFDDALKRLCIEVPFFSETSHKIVIRIFEMMVEGKMYTRRGNTETTIYFTEQIGRDYGKDTLRNALQATRYNIIYFYEQSGNKSNSMRRGCQKIADENEIDIKFDESIFNGGIYECGTCYMAVCK